MNKVIILEIIILFLCIFGAIKFYGDTIKTSTFIALSWYWIYVLIKDIMELK